MGTAHCHHNIHHAHRNAYKITNVRPVAKFVVQIYAMLNHVCVQSRAQIMAVVPVQMATKAAVVSIFAFLFLEMQIE